MEEKALRSLAPSLLSFGANKLITVSTTIVLARLLNPTEFGVFALAIMALSLLSMFNDFGFGMLLIARQDLDEAAKGTMLTIMIATSSVLALALALASAPVAGLFSEPRLRSLLVIISGTLLLSGPVWFYDTVLQRELEFKSRLIAQCMQNVTFAAVAIGLVLLDHGVTGMVVANVASYVVYLGCLLLMAPYHVRPRFQRSWLRELLIGGRGFVVQGGVLFAQQNADNLTVARALGSGPLGAYFLAYRLAALTWTGIAEPVTNVTFSAFARMRHRGEAWAGAYISTLRMIVLASCAVALVLSAAAGPVTHLFYGPKWVAMIEPLAILGVWAVMRPLEWTLTSLLNAIGESDVAALMASAGIVPFVAALILAASVAGLNGVAWVVTAHSAAMVIALAVVISRRGGISVGDQGRAVGTILLAGAAGWAVARPVADAMSGSPAVLALLAAAGGGGLAYAAVLSLTDPGLVRGSVAQVARTLRRPKAE